MDKTPQNENTDLEVLMRRAQQGDKQAYDTLLRSIIPILRGFVIRRLGPGADVEDVVQNILLSIHRASHTYDTERPFKIWMFAIARHRLNDHLRHIYKRNVPEVPFDDLANEIQATDVTAERERSEYLKSMLDRLPARQRQIVTMMKVEGYSAQDVAAKMNMSVSAVKVAAHRAYKTLALAAERDGEV